MSKRTIITTKKDSTSLERDSGADGFATVQPTKGVKDLVKSAEERNSPTSINTALDLSYNLPEVVTKVDGQLESASSSSVFTLSLLPKLAELNSLFKHEEEIRQRHQFLTSQRGLDDKLQKEELMLEQVIEWLGSEGKP